MIKVLDMFATTPDVTLKIVGALGVDKLIILNKLSTHFKQTVNLAMEGTSFLGPISPSIILSW